MLSKKKRTRSTGFEDSVVRAADALLSSKYAVAMTGAGMSVESGIPTFRGKNGLWTRYGQPAMDGFSRFRSDPVEWWQQQINRQMDEHIILLRDALRSAKPHEGHHALARLHRAGAIDHVITQNIDGLDLKAGLRSLTEIHGNRSRLRCVDCGERRPLGDFIPVEPPEPCERCDGVVKFDTVMFGEPIPADTLEEARRHIGMADCIMAVGTSATVRPASGLLWIGKSNGATMIEINPAETKLTGICDVVVRATAGEALPAILDELTARSGPGGTAGS